MRLAVSINKSSSTLIYYSEQEKFWDEIEKSGHFKFLMEHSDPNLVYCVFELVENGKTSFELRSYLITETLDINTGKHINTFCKKELAIQEALLLR